MMTVALLEARRSYVGVVPGGGRHVPLDVYVLEPGAVLESQGGRGWAEKQLRQLAVDV